VDEAALLNASVILRATRTRLEQDQATTASEVTLMPNTGSAS
jgi:hypothetical protein